MIRRRGRRRASGGRGDEEILKCEIGINGLRFTENDEGVQVTANGAAKIGITKLYAHWPVYVDPSPMRFRAA